MTDRAAGKTHTILHGKRARTRGRLHRLGIVAALCVALGATGDAASCADIDIAAALAAGTDDTTAPPATNIHRVAGFLPQASVPMLPGAAHYTFMDICAPAAAQRAASLCKDAPGVDREAVHDATAARVLTFFDTALPEKAGSGGAR